MPIWKSRTTLYLYFREVFFLPQNFDQVSRSHRENVFLVLNIYDMHSNVHMLGSSMGATQKLPLPFATQLKCDGI